MPRASAIVSLALYLCIAVNTASAETRVRVVSFTADWCPTCRVFDPRLKTAIRETDPNSIVLSEFDLSETKSTTVRQQDTVHPIRAEQWKVGRIWRQYQGRTGFAVLASFDTGEILGCISPEMSPRQIRERLTLAIKSSAETNPGSRPILGNDCPDRKAG